MRPTLHLEDKQKCCVIGIDYLLRVTYGLCLCLYSKRPTHKGSRFYGSPEKEQVKQKIATSHSQKPSPGP